MIKIEKLTVSFGDHLVLNGLDAEFIPGGVYGIVGLNGAGKSTFFNVMSSAIKATSGSVKYDSAPMHYKQMSFLETNNYFFSDITGREYLSIFQQTNTDFVLDTWLGLLHLPIDDLVESYSTGMKKKLALLGILKMDRPIYLLDEPFNGLDLETNMILEMVVVALKKKGKTIFISSHILDPLLKVCDEIRLLEKGRLDKIYLRSQFNDIEEDLFGSLKAKAADIVRGAM